MAVASPCGPSFEMAGGDHCPILDRTYDLKSAYKQFGFFEANRNLLRIAINKLGNAHPTLVGMNSLPVGAVGLVAGFLRISFALWWIGVYGLGIAWSADFDDYSPLTRSELEASTNWPVIALFDLIGIFYAKKRDRKLLLSPKP